MKLKAFQHDAIHAGRCKPPRDARLRPWRGALAAFLTMLVAWGIAVPHARADAKPFQEYEVKAGFLFHFVQFVDWPDSAFAGKDAPIAIGVLGADPFGAILDQIVQGETVHNRKLIVKRSNKLDELKSCQVLFISKSEKDRIPQILNDLGNAPVLTVSETEGFAAQGGIFNFYVADNKVRFEINPDAAKRRGITISSKLLGLGTVVH